MSIECLESSAFEIRIGGVCRRVGVNRNVERVLRGKYLTEGVDWMLRSNAVHYCAEGVARLLGKIGEVAWGVGEGSSTEAGRMPAVPAVRGLIPWPLDSARPEIPVRVVVCRHGLQTLNSQVVECRVEGGHVGGVRMELPEKSGVRIVVRVRSNVNFVVGMVLLARRPAGANGDGVAWEFCGRGDVGHEALTVPVCPRWRGKW